MNKLIITAVLASLVGSVPLAWAGPSHHAVPAAGSVHRAPLKCGRHHRARGRRHTLRCEHGDRMMGNGGMGPDHMQQMHGQMDHGAMMGSGGMMGGAQPSGTPSPAAAN